MRTIEAEEEPVPPLPPWTKKEMVESDAACNILWKSLPIMRVKYV
jgi:hypothetical protein